MKRMTMLSRDDPKDPKEQRKNNLLMVGSITAITLLLMAVYVVDIVETESRQVFISTSLIAYEYCAVATCTISDIAIGDKIFVWAKGNVQDISAVTIQLNEDGVEVGRVDVDTVADRPESFPLMYSTQATLTSHTYTVTSTGALTNVKLMIQVYR
jgi:hypothetical protein